MFFKEGMIKDSFDVIKYAMNLHYPVWDTQGREESDIPNRIEEYSSFIVKNINISDIEEPYFFLDEGTVDEYSELEVSTMPPIVLSEQIKGKYMIIDGCHRYYASIKNKQIDILAFVPII